MDGANTQIKGRNGVGILLPAVGLMLAAVACLFLLTTDFDFNSSFQYLYLFPWIALVAVIVFLPTFWQLRKRQFDISHPLVFPVFTYFFPVFVIGGLLLASGLSQPYFMHYIEDPAYHLPLTFVYVALGFGGLTAGFLIPVARKIGANLSSKMPAWDWEPQSVLLPGVILLGIGVAFYMSSWFAGIVGYQTVDLTSETFSGLTFFLSLLVLEAGFLLWMAVFRARQININFIIALGIFFATIPVRIILGGNRGGLLQILIVIILAFFLSGRKVKPKHLTIFGVLGVFALIFGLVYGTTFRNIKGSDSKANLDEYIENAGLTVELIMRQDAGKTFQKAMMDLSERIEQTSSLAVVVANYEKLAPYEAAYGLENNIWTYTWTAFIPRFVWSDKPVISDARAYSDLYFNFTENSFAITPMGDLLRNFGPFGVPLGMMLLGFVLRIIYATLIENQPVTLGRATLYFMFVTTVSYEGFYGTILPSLLRVGAICFISLFIVGIVIGRKRAPGQ